MDIRFPVHGGEGRFQGGEPNFWGMPEERFKISDVLERWVLSPLVRIQRATKTLQRKHCPTLQMR